jgi:hypothetical protein
MIYQVNKIQHNLNLISKDRSSAIRGHGASIADSYNLRLRMVTTGPLPPSAMLFAGAKLGIATIPLKNIIHSCCEGFAQ